MTVQSKVDDHSNIYNIYVDTKTLSVISDAEIAKINEHICYFTSHRYEASEKNELFDPQLNHLKHGDLSKYFQHRPI